jgi:hypothetical protein
MFRSMMMRIPFLVPLLVMSVGAQQAGSVEDLSEAELDGHRRMLDLLEEVRVETPKRNPYLGDRQLRRFRKMLDDGAQLPKKTRARLHYDIGVVQLRLGRNQESLASLERSIAILEEYPRSEWPPFSVKLFYDLGIAYLRWGETQNCVNRYSPASCILPIVEAGIHVDKEGSLEAMKWMREVLAISAEDSPEELSARWLLNVAAMTVGEYPDGLSAEERIAPEVFESEAQFPRFSDVAPEVGLDTFNLCGGAVAEDFDGDGDLDILTSTWDTGGQLRYFENDGVSAFVERTKVLELTGILGGLNLLHADYDDDGYIDAFVLRGGWLFGPRGKHPNSLLRNVGGERFLDATFLAGMGEDHFPTQTGGWADYDLDGDLDLFLGNEATRENPFACQLFTNQGDGTFVDTAEQAGVENNFYTKGVSWGDYDNDRYPDLYVSNLGSPNRLYRNLGDGTFENVAPDLKVWQPMSSFPTWFWDYDNDGNLDLFVSAYDQGQSNFEAAYRLAPVVASYIGRPVNAELARLYRGDGAGGFVDVSKQANLTRLTLPMGANFGDLDNDGFPDAYLGTGYPYYDGLIPNVMLWNRGGRSFSDVTTAGGFGHLQKGHGVVFADLDNDGDQDVFEQIGGAYAGDAFGNVLFENPGFGNHWLKVRLTGVASNRSAIGARIRVEFEEDGETRSVYRRVNSGGSFGCNSFTQHLGVGQATEVDVLEVFWPRTGKTQTFRDIAVDQRVEILEGAEEAVFFQETPFRLGG